MIRTQIYITETVHKKLSALAEVKGEPMAKVVRDILAERLDDIGEIDYSGKEALKNLLALRFKGGPSDLSVNLDYYLYGALKRDTK